MNNLASKPTFQEDFSDTVTKLLGCNVNGLVDMLTETPYNHQ